MINPDVLDRADRATILVGRGRGFVVEGADGRLVVTAAQCLPHVPPSIIDPILDQRTFGNVLAPLRSELRVSARCLFIDPIGDLAVLGPVEGEEMVAEVRAYETLVQSLAALQVGHVRGEEAALFAARDRCWFQCTASCSGRGPLFVRADAAALSASMPGALIITEDGLAVGIVASAEDQGGGARQPALADHLPGWLVRDLGLMDRARPSA
jgi:hypothetical protein